MSKITPGNRLYFYQLFSTQMGIGKQTALQRVEEVLAEADVLLDDVECESVEELLDALSDFMKLTVFKKGRVFVTVMPREDLDELLEKAAQTAVEKAPAGAGMSSWKRARRSKDVKPVKPRHRRPPAKKVVEEAATAVVEAAEHAKAAVTEAVAEIEAHRHPETEEPAYQAEATNDTAASPEEASAAPEPQEAPAPMTEAEVETAPAPEPEAVPEPEATPAPETDASSEPEAKPEAEPEDETDIPEPVETLPAETPQEVEPPRAAPEPSITFNITYVPEEAPGAPELAEAADDIEPASEPPVVRRSSRRKPLRAVHLPKALSNEVFFPDELLLKLYQALPDTVGLLETLDESWEFARQAGTAEGSRKRFSFPLSRVIEGQLPIEVTVERVARLASGKAWRLVKVDTGDDGLAGDDAAPSGTPLDVPIDEPGTPADEA